ncbi:MAG: choice-of-anchor Q domain-containing protein [Chloroflexota bacterium]
MFDQRPIPLAPTTWVLGRLLVAVLAWLALSAVHLQPAHAATRTVTTLEDTFDGTCNADCSIFDAITAAAPGDTIAFQNGLAGTLTLVSGELPINKTLTIAGPGAKVLAISGNNASRIFNVAGGVALTVTDLTLRNGRDAPATTPGLGGAILNFGSLTLSRVAVRDSQARGGVSGTAGQSGSGGGLASVGSSSLSLTDVAFDNNAAVGGAGSGAGVGTGGALSIGAGAGTVTIDRTTFSNNLAQGGNSDTAASVGGGLGGAIDSVATMTITNSTFSANAARAGTAPTAANAGGSGGAISLTLGALGSATLTNVTIAHNLTTGGVFSSGGGVLVSSGTVLFRNTIVAHNTLNSNGNNCSGTIGGGNNLEFGANTCPGGGVFSLGNPILAALADNGGVGMTHALLPGSAAIDTGNNNVCPAVDQRLASRAIHRPCDIGAFELPTRGAPVTTSPAGLAPSHRAGPAPSGPTPSRAPGHR